MDGKGPEASPKSSGRELGNELWERSALNMCGKKNKPMGFSGQDAIFLGSNRAKALCLAWSPLLNLKFVTQLLMKLLPKPHMGSVASGHEESGLCPTDSQEDKS